MRSFKKGSPFKLFAIFCYVRVKRETISNSYYITRTTPNFEFMLFITERIPVDVLYDLIKILLYLVLFRIKFNAFDLTSKEIRYYKILK